MPIAILLVFICCFICDRRKKRMSKKRDYILFGLLFIYCMVMGGMLLLPLHGTVPFFDVSLRLRPLETTSAFMKDIFQNGFFVQAPENTKGIMRIFESFSHSARNILGNTLFFVPFGVLLQMRMPTIKWWKALLFAVLVPLFIELWQAAFCYGRTSDVDDLLLNAAGIGSGFAVTAALQRHGKNKRNKEENG